MIDHNAQQRPVVVHLRRVAAEEGMPEKYGIKITYTHKKPPRKSFPKSTLPAPASCS